MRTSNNEDTSLQPPLYENDNETLVDILPSFQMHNFMLNRPIDDKANVDQPPNYEDSSTIASTVVSRQTSLDPSNFLLNNLDKLQKINMPFKAEITLTEELNKVGVPFKQANPLKTYKPGDMVYGFVLFQNPNNFPIPFEQVMISMECDIGTVSPNGKVVKKKIITAYDLEASFNMYGAEGDNDTYHMLDPLDKNYLGFEKRRLDPNIPIKKFFKFRIPHYVLDDCCDSQLWEHLKTPPSFGLNKKSARNTAAALKIDNHLGYGRFDNPSSPMVVKDYAPPNQFVSFYISAQFIGKKLDLYKRFYTKSTHHNYDFIFLKNVEHHFRVTSSVPEEEPMRLISSTDEQLRLLENQAIEAIEVMTERGMLNKVGVTALQEQDEIIFSSNGKAKQQYDVTADSICKKYKPDLFTKSVQIHFKKDLFSKMS
ncbi:hypothetical protein JL09_g3855, partial [Pichia kudriavzevii]